MRGLCGVIQQPGGGMAELVAEGGPEPLFGVEYLKGGHCYVKEGSP
jgi:hypothetical protein